MRKHDGSPSRLDNVLAIQRHVRMAVHGKLLAIHCAIRKPPRRGRTRRVRRCCDTVP
jgi:hypothetical protein